VSLTTQSPTPEPAVPPGAAGGEQALRCLQDLAADGEAFQLLVAILQRSYATLLGPDGGTFVDEYFEAVEQTLPAASLDALWRTVVGMRRRFRQLGLERVYLDEFRARNLDTSLRLAGASSFAGPVVDVGAGDNLLGSRLLRMAPHVDRVTGVDTRRGDPHLDPPRLRFAQQADPRSLPLASASCASAVCRYSLHHMTAEEQDAIAAETHRVLSPDGRWIVYENAYSPHLAPLGEDPGGLHERLLALADPERIVLLLACLDTFSLGIKDKDMQFANTFRSVEEWQSFFRARSFTVERCRYYGLPVHDLHQAPLTVLVLTKAPAR
jgi:SAM-dependent methyltransferase